MTSWSVLHLSCRWKDSRLSSPHHTTFREETLRTPATQQHILVLRLDLQATSLSRVPSHPSVSTRSWGEWVDRCSQCKTCRLPGRSPCWQRSRSLDQNWRRPVEIRSSCNIARHSSNLEFGWQQCSSYHSNSTSRFHKAPIFLKTDKESKHKHNTTRRVCNVALAISMKVRLWDALFAHVCMRCIIVRCIRFLCVYVCARVFACVCMYVCYIRCLFMQTSSRATQQCSLSYAYKPFVITLEKGEIQTPSLVFSLSPQFMTRMMTKDI